MGSVTVTVTNLLMILTVHWHQLDHMQIICMSGARFKWSLLTQETATALPSVLWRCWFGITMCIWHVEWWDAGVVVCLECSGVAKGGAGRPWRHLPRGGTSTTIKKFLVHGQVTIIFVVSVCLYVCLSVCLCRVFLSRLWSDFDQTWTYVICLGLVVSHRI